MAGLPVRPLEGSGPWSLVDVADAAGVSYDMVYRDVRQGVLPVSAPKARTGGRPHYLVSLDGLRRSARPAYRHVAATQANRRAGAHAG